MVLSPSMDLAQSIVRSPPPTPPIGLPILGLIYDNNCFLPFPVPNLQRSVTFCIHHTIWLGPAAPPRFPLFFAACASSMVKLALIHLYHPSKVYLSITLSHCLTDGLWTIGPGPARIFAKTGRWICFPGKALFCST